MRKQSKKSLLKPMKPASRKAKGSRLERNIGKICFYDLCNKQAVCKGLCKKHYENERIKAIRHKQRSKVMNEIESTLKQPPHLENVAAAWLQGFADGEGHVTKSMTKSGRHSTRTISITNTENALIEKACSCLDKLGIQYYVRSISMMNKKPAKIIIISHQRNLLEWRKKVGFTSIKKLQRLEENILEYQSVRFAWNTKKYEQANKLRASGLGYEQIGLKLGFSTSTIRRYFNKKEVKAYQI